MNMYAYLLAMCITDPTVTFYINNFTDILAVVESEINFFHHSNFIILHSTKLCLIRTCIILYLHCLHKFSWRGV